MTDPAPAATPARPGKSPGLGLLGCGCGALVVGLMILMLTVTVLTYRVTERLEAGYDDPELAAVQVRKILPHDKLPKGYFPLGGASAPVLLKLALLTDLPPEEREGGEGARRFHRSGFVFFSTISLLRDDSEQLRFFQEGPAAGEEEVDLDLPEDWIGGDLGMDFEAREVVARGEEAIDRGRAYYVAQRGRLEVSGDAFQGLATSTYLKCEKGRRVRYGLWFAPEPESGDLSATPADPEALVDFLGHFRICG